MLLVFQGGKVQYVQTAFAAHMFMVATVTIVANSSLAQSDYQSQPIVTYALEFPFGPPTPIVASSVGL